MFLSTSPCTYDRRCAGFFWPLPRPGLWAVATAGFSLRWLVFLFFWPLHGRSFCFFYVFLVASSAGFCFLAVARPWAFVAARACVFVFLAIAWQKLFFLLILGRFQRGILFFRPLHGLELLSLRWLVFLFFWPLHGWSFFFLSFLGRFQRGSFIFWPLHGLGLLSLPRLGVLRTGQKGLLGGLQPPPRPLCRSAFDFRKPRRLG